MKKMIFMLLFMPIVVQAMPLEMKTIQGEKVEFNHGKKKELVLFWATWCATCKVKLKEVLPEYNKRADVSVQTVNIDKNVERAKEYIKKYSVELPVLRDDSQTLVKELNVVTAPHWAVYEKEGDTWKLKGHEEAFNLDKINALLN